MENIQPITKHPLKIVEQDVNHGLEEDKNQGKTVLTDFVFQQQCVFRLGTDRIYSNTLFLAHADTEKSLLTVKGLSQEDCRVSFGGVATSFKHGYDNFTMVNGGVVVKDPVESDSNPAEPWLTLDGEPYRLVMGEKGEKFYIPNGFTVYKYKTLQSGHTQVPIFFNPNKAITMNGINYTFVKARFGECPERNLYIPESLVLFYETALWVIGDLEDSKIGKDLIPKGRFEYIFEQENATPKIKKIKTAGAAHVVVGSDVRLLQGSVQQKVMLKSKNHSKITWLTHSKIDELTIHAEDNSMVQAEVIAAKLRCTTTGNSQVFGITCTSFFGGLALQRSIQNVLVDGEIKHENVKDPEADIKMIDISGRK